MDVSRKSASGLLRGALLVATAGLVSGCGTLAFVRYGVLPMSFSTVDVGKPVADVDLVTIEGGETSLLGAIRDRPTVLVFGSFS